jgi:hypothetical protein
MEKYYFLVNLIVYSIIPTLVALYVTERVKGSVKNSFDRKLEEVKKEYSLEISQFQTELNYLKTKENFKFTKLHERRLKVLKITYYHINHNLTLLEKYLMLPSNKNMNEEEQNFQNIFLIASQDFYKYFDLNAIYFNEELSGLIHNYFEEISEIFIEHHIRKTNLLVNIEPNENLFTVSAASRALIRMNILPIKKQIELEFRKLLGE